MQQYGLTRRPIKTKAELHQRKDYRTKSTGQDDYNQCHQVPDKPRN